MTAPALPDVDLDALTGEKLECTGFPQDDCVNEPDYLITGAHFCGSTLHKMLCRDCTTRLREDWFSREELGARLTCPFCGIHDLMENFNLKIRPI